MLLFDARIKRGLTQEELAKQAGISQALISLLENGKRFAGCDILTRIEEALQYQVDWIGTRFQNNTLCSDAYENAEPEDTVLKHIWEYVGSASFVKRPERVEFLRRAVMVLQKNPMKGAKRVQWKKSEH